MSMPGSNQNLQSAQYSLKEQGQKGKADDGGNFYRAIEMLPQIPLEIKLQA